MFSFLETDITERQKYKKRIQTSVDNTVNDLRYEIKFENCMKDKTNIFIKRNISFFFNIKVLYFKILYFIPGNIFLRFLLSI